MANMQLWAQLLENWGYPLLGTFSNGAPATGFVSWIYARNLVELVITGGFTWIHILQSATYAGFMIIGSIVFGFFWVQTSGMDAKAQAKNIISSGLISFIFGKIFFLSTIPTQKPAKSKSFFL